MKLPRDKLFWFFSAFAIFVFIGLMLPAAQPVYWVGGCPLEINFVAVDSESGQKIPRAEVFVSVESKGCCSDDYPDEKFTLMMNEEGVSTASLKSCMCFGKDGPFHDTFAIHIPEWFVIASAKGYVSSECAPIDVFENRRAVVRGKGKASVTITIKLTKQ
jgi:hypothetical protein